jgi:hypothetical protein
MESPAMLSRFPLRSAALLLPLLVAACASSSSPVAYQGLESATRLKPVKDDEAPFQYCDAAADFGRYRAIEIDPVVVYEGADQQFGSVSAEDRRAVADYMRAQFGEILGARYAPAAVPGPDVLRLRLTLTGIETSTPVISTISHLMPVGLVVNGGLQAAGRNGTFFGSVSYAAELSDSATGTLFYAYVTRQTPDALDVTASLGSLAAAREGVRIGAAHLRDRLGASCSTPANA